MPPVIAAGVSFLVPLIGIGGAVAIGNIALFLTTGIVGQLVLGVGLSVAARAIQGKPKLGASSANMQAAAAAGQSLSVSMSSDEPRWAALGKTATAGSLVTWQSWTVEDDKPNEFIGLVFALADHKCDGLVGGWWGGKPMTINEDGSVQEAFASGQHNLWIYFKDGDWNQTAHADLVANSDGRWTEDDRGRGVCNVMIVARYNEKAHPNGLSGLFRCLWEIRGARLFDRRLSSEDGGSGSQEADEPGAWSFSDNLAVAAEAILRGIAVEDTTEPPETRTKDRIFGLGLTSAELPFDENVAAMNICDEEVDLKGGGTEPRYRMSGMIPCTQTAESVLEDLMGAMAGKLLAATGRWVILAGAARTAVRTIEDGILRLDGPRTFRADTPLSETINAIYGTFSDPTQQYAVLSLPARLNPANEGLDGGRKEAAYDLTYVASHTQGQRVMEIYRRRARLQRKVRFALPPGHIDLEAGDWITRVSSRPLFATHMEIDTATLRTAEDDFLMVVVDAHQEAATVYAWDPDVDELDPPSSSTLESSAPLGVAPAGLTVSVVNLSGSIGRIPALAVSWTHVQDQTSIGLKFEWRIVSSGDVVAKVIDADPGAGIHETLLAEGVTGSALYEVRAAIRYQPPRDDVWTDWTAAGGSTDPSEVGHASTADNADHAVTADTAAYADEAGSGWPVEP